MKKRSKWNFVWNRSTKCRGRGRGSASIQCISTREAEISLRVWRMWRNVPNRPMAGDISKEEEVGRRMTLEFFHSISYTGKVLNFRYKTLLRSKIQCGRGKAWSIFPRFQPPFAHSSDASAKNTSLYSYFILPFTKSILCNYLVLIWASFFPKNKFVS